MSIENYALAESMLPPEGIPFNVQTGQVTFVDDTNNTYSSNDALQFSMKELANSGKKLYVSNSYIRIPFIIRSNLIDPTTGSAFATGNANRPRFCTHIAGAVNNPHSLRNGIWPTLYSMSVSCGNVQTVQKSSDLGTLCLYEYKSNESTETAEKETADTLYARESNFSVLNQVQSNALGRGVGHTNIIPIAYTMDISWNDGH
jgi:hypothetical protein